MRILFFGTPDFAARVLEALLSPPAGAARARHEVVGVVSQPSRPGGRGLRVEDPAAARVAHAAGIPVFQPERLHAAETVASLRALTPDLCLTAAFGRLLRPPLLELAPRGCWNVHASLLPRHRGASPVCAAILAGDAWTGVTIFQLDTGLDTGPVLRQEMITIGPEETAGELTDRLARIGGRLAVEACDCAQRGELVGRPQAAWGATYASQVGKEDGRLEWNRPVEQVERAVRAYAPWPGAFTVAGGRRLLVHRARPWHRLAVAGADPGSLVRAPAGVGVVCNPGVLLLREVQGEGRKRQEATEWLRGSRLPEGARLG